uniref:Uncharacterized protein n=1 Tax=Aegilops tauschii TaxID=37682 RepID=N1QS07_AEGTA
MKSSSQSHSPRTPSPRARGTAAAPGADHARSSSEPWVLACVDDTCVNDVESFARTVAAVKSKPRPTCSRACCPTTPPSRLPDVATSASGRFLPPESPTATVASRSVYSWRPSSPRSRRTAQRRGRRDKSLVRGRAARAARRLAQATLAAVMIPAFGHAPGGSTLLDVRLVREFLKEGGKGSNQTLRCQTAHPGAAKEESKSLWRLIDAWKLSVEGAAHAVQNY